MKSIVKALSAILAVCLCVISCVCVYALAEQESNIGLYTYIGYSVNGRYIHDETQATWSVNLRKDGKGYLFWGEDNQGETTWSMSDGKLVINAGISVIEGVIEDGVMQLDMGDGIIIGWAGPNTDLSKLDIISAEEFFANAAQAKGEIPEEAAGVYYPFATTIDGYCIAYPQRPEDGTFTLNADGSAEMTTGDKVNKFRWSSSDGNLTIYDETGALEIFHGTLKDGIMMINITYAEADGSAAASQSYFATDDADTSVIETITVDEYTAITSAE